MNVANVKNCTGCGACFNKCPVNSIKMVLDSEGFYKPQIDDSCVDCGICERICPAEHPIYTNNPEPDCYALMASDEIRAKSSSGGAFTLLADYVLERNGYVCGAVFGEDFRTVYHVVSNKRSVFEKMRGSKYVQSDTRNCFAEIKELLQDGNDVLFAGCPCQVAGLYAFLGCDEPKLITVDLICHGIPSVGVWQSYLDEEFKGKRLSHVGFRDKDCLGWRSGLCLKFTDGSTYQNPESKDLFFSSYLNRIDRNKSCGECVFNCMPRQGDITIGDYWGINDFNPKLNDQQGTSVVTINNTGIKHLVDFLCQNAKLMQKTPLESATAKNQNLIRHLPNHASRNHFFRMIKNIRIVNAAIHSTVAERFDVGVVGIPVHPNFGGAVTYYALYKAIYDLGYSVKMISRPLSKYGPDTPEMVYEKTPYPANVLALNFAGKAHLSTLNNVCDRFMIGSDQLLEYYNYLEFDRFITLDWVKDNHIKSAYAASFGHNRYRGPEDVRAEVAYYLQKFDSFSVREDDGIRLAKEVFGVNAQQVLDPVFLCDKRHLEELAKKTENKSNTSHIFAYILDPEPEKNEILKYVSKKQKLSVELYSEMPPLQMDPKLFSFPLRQGKMEQRLDSIISSDFVVADSFHGICFAIIFHKPFIAILNARRGASRFYSILSKLNLLDKLVTTKQDLLTKIDIFDSPDYNEVERLLQPEVERSYNWLKKALNGNINKPYSDNDIIEKKLSTQEVKNRQFTLQINALFNGRLFLWESNLLKYLDMLSQYRNEIAVFIAVKDTPGHYLTPEIAEKLHKLGLSVNLTDKHWRSYCATVDGGKVLFEALGEEKKEVRYISKINNIMVKLVSKSYICGNIAYIGLGGIDYSENKRGLNIVVLDKNQNVVIDSVCFDTHVKSHVCMRNSTVCTGALPAKALTAIPAQALQSETPAISQ